MPSSARRRPEQEFEATPGQLGVQRASLSDFSGGYNGYTDSELLSPQFWAQASNVYSGQFRTVRRARFAPVVNVSTSGYAAQGARFSTLFSFRDATPQDSLLGFIGQSMWSFNVNGNYAATRLTDGVLSSNSDSRFAGPWSLNGIGGVAFGMNGQIKRKFRGVNLATIENWGLDTPDAAPSFASTGTSKAGGTAADLGDRSEAWANPNNIFATGTVNFATSNAGNNTVFPHQNLPTNTIRVTNFGFALVAGAPVFGIQVSFQFESAFNGTPYTVFAQLVKAGVPVGTVKQFSFSGNTTPFFIPLGTGNDMWGVASILGSDVNAANFGVQFYFVAGVNGTPTLSANSVNLTAFVPSGQGSGNITKVIGRSYTFAWENVNVENVGAPSPTMPYFPETNAVNTITCLEPGSVTTSNVSPTVNVIGTIPSAAWVNRHLWATGIGDAGLIVAVNVGAGTLTLKANAPSSQTSVQFQIFDPQATHIRLYATGDGQPVYFRIQRNAFVSSATDAVSAGLSFTDNDNSEPPNGEFTSEIEQLFNLPPPIGTFTDQYQAREIVYGVAGALQSFFYSNFENTSVGFPPEDFGPLNQVTLPMGDAKMNGFANLPTGAIIWSSKQDMFKLTGLLSDNSVSTDTQLGATIQRLPYRMGCASPYAVAVTNLGVFWLTSDRQVMLFTDHYAPKNVGQSIQDILNTANRLSFAKMKNYRNGDRNWLELSISTGTSTFNNKKLILDLDLLASNGSPSFFTFDMATNQPSWYPYDVPCEAVEVSPDANSIYHTLSGDVDVITETDFQTGYFTVSAEQIISGAGFTTHALGNDAPHVIKTLGWMRANTNQLPKYLASQGWKWQVASYDDDSTVLGIAAKTISLVPGSDSLSSIISLENSPSVFRFGGVRFSKGRRFQFQTIFPNLPGLYELRSLNVEYTNVVSR